MSMTDLSHLAPLVQVQPESTVSRIVLRAEGLRVVHLSTRLPHEVEAVEPSKLALLMMDDR